MGVANEDWKMLAVDNEIGLDELKDDPGVLDLYLRYGNFKKTGREFESYCPFHVDTKTPSLKLNRDNGRWLWHCFGACQRGGSIIDFVMEHDRVGEGEAIQRIKVDLGWDEGYRFSAVDLPRPVPEVEEEPVTVSWDDYAVAEKNLAARKDVQEWLLRERGITFETAKRFHLGFCQKCKYDASNVRDRGWILIPYIENNQIVLIKFRSIFEKRIVRKSGMRTCLYNLDNICLPASPPNVFIVAGEFDTMVLVQAGFKSISLPGDGFVVTEEMASKLQALAGDGKAILAGDNDTSGQKRMMKTQTVLPSSPLIQWPAVKDANELWLKHKDDLAGFKNLINRLTDEAEKKHVTPAVHDVEIPSGPQLSDDALYGLAGDIVRKLIPHTEADPAALLVGTLARFGNVVGPTAFFKVEDTNHYCNIFAVNVGATSKARKGTSADRIARIFESVDPAWHENRNFSGLSSGEGVISNVRDRRVGDNGETLDAGASDKRMFIYESEFASSLQVMKREGNILSPIIRNAWDGRPLQLLVKNNPMKASGTHISVLADITADELQLTLAMADQYNGFANRFLWLHVERRGLKPFGGGDIDWTDEVERLRKTVEFTRQRRRVFMDRNARLMWERVYAELSSADRGLIGAVTSRAEAQVIRLALLYAMLDQSQHITVEHLQAGLAVWEYAEASARYIFGGLSREQHQILNFLTTLPNASKSDIYTICFKNRRKASLIGADLETLTGTKQIISQAGSDGVGRFSLNQG
jgi:hypothetical protein